MALMVNMKSFAILDHLAWDLYFPELQLFFTLFICFHINMYMALFSHLTDQCLCSFCKTKTWMERERDV